jgi:hypothetical protein
MGWSKEKSKEYNNRPEVRDRARQYGRDYRKRPYVIAKNKERCRLNRLKPSYKLTYKNWCKNNPERILEHNKKYLEDATLFNTTIKKYKWALQSWSKSIKKRDNQECQVCPTIEDLKIIESITGIKNDTKQHNKEKLISHHILYKSNYPLLSLNLNNGITVCKVGHIDSHLFDKWGVG